ncbi:hypothetical protein [Streptomyces luteireticuli]|uniref:Uncharacterized protein n=1 Tax=Streptomyces luteireticuli TaxID=173858 RepID=A0ABP3IU85_9ACTN
MFTGSAEELARRQQQACRHAEAIAALLSEIAALDLGPAVGCIAIPGVGELRATSAGWTIR